MASKYDAVSAKIVEAVGGKGNVVSLTHCDCVTRLRFVLNDPSKADKEALNQTQYVIKVLEAGGQLQVVVGNKVDGIYDSILATQGISGGGAAAADGGAAPADEKGVLNKLMGTISGIMVPTLGVLTAAGIIKGVVSFLALENIGVLNPASGLYMLLYAIGDGFFYFLPIRWASPPPENSSAASSSAPASALPWFIRPWSISRPRWRWRVLCSQDPPLR